MKGKRKVPTRPKLVKFMSTATKQEHGRHTGCATGRSGQLRETHGGRVGAEDGVYVFLHVSQVEVNCQLGLEHRCAMTMNTDQEGITDNPDGVATTAADVGTKAEIEDTAQAHVTLHFAKVHVRIADGPRLAPESKGNIDAGVTGCGGVFISAYGIRDANREMIALFKGVVSTHGMPKSPPFAHRGVERPRWP